MIYSLLQAILLGLLLLPMAAISSNVDARDGIGSQGETLTTTWMGAVEAVVAQATKNRSAVLGFVEAFRSSEYTGVYSPRDGLVFVTTRDQGDLATSKLEEIPHWVVTMRDLGFQSVDRVSSPIRVIGDSFVSTDKHDFPFELFFESVDDLARCDARFEVVECGVCIGASNDDFDTLVSWVSRALKDDFVDAESGEDEDQQRDRVKQCIMDGIDEALNIQKIPKTSDSELAD